MSKAQATTVIAERDKAWFNETCRNMAVRVCGRYYPQWVDDAEAEARLYAWVAYAKRLTRPAVAWAARNGATDYYRAQVGRLKKKDRATGEISFVYGHLDSVHLTDSLMCVDQNGAEYDHLGLPVGYGGIDTLTGNMNFEHLISVLPERYSKVLRLRYRDGYECQEIAALLGTSPNRVCQIVSLSMKTLRKTWLDEMALQLGGLPNGRDDALIAKAFAKNKPRPSVLKGPDRRFRASRSEKYVTQERDAGWFKPKIAYSQQ